MPRIFTATDIDKEEKDVRKDYFDRHMPVILCESSAKKGKKFAVKIRVGTDYSHPDDHNHYIKYVQLWNRETLLAQAEFPPGTLGNQKSQVEVVFYTIQAASMNLRAMAYCTNHGLWQSEPFSVKIKE
jgi:superoxide reductase